MALLGERLSAPEALELGVIDAMVPEADVARVSIERAGALASKAAPVLTRLRRGFYGAAIDALREI
jgi:enoyl-CoA hydratase/carnithine racemase